MQVMCAYKYIDGLDCRISSGLAIQVLQSCTMPSIYVASKYGHILHYHYIYVSQFANTNLYNIHLATYVLYQWISFRKIANIFDR